MPGKKDFSNRKELRLKKYDYSSTGAYFVTICVKDRMPILSHILKPVGGGALDAPQVQLTEIGRIIEKNLLSSENISGVKIDRYVIMPDHIHAIIFLDSNKYIQRKNGSSKAPTPTNAVLPRVISAFKRFCNKEVGRSIFECGYYEHIVRDRADYETRIKYMYENPIYWCYNEAEKIIH